MMSIRRRSTVPSNHFPIRALLTGLMQRLMAATESPVAATWLSRGSGASNSPATRALSPSSVSIAMA